MRPKLKISVLGLLLVAGVLTAGWWWWWRQAQQQAAVEAAIPALPSLNQAPPRLAEALVVAQQRARVAGTARAGLGDLARLYHANGYFEEARQAYEALVRLEPENPQWPHLLAVIVAGYGELDRAVELWRRTIALAPEYRPALLRLADALLKANAVEEAGSAYQQVLARWPDDPYALLGLARIDFEAERWREALPRLERLVAMTDYRLGYDLIVDVYERLGRKADADAVRGKMKASGAFREAPDPWVDDLIQLCFDPYRIAIAAGARSEPGEVRDLLLRAIELAPDEVSYRLQLSAHYVEQRDAAGARRELQELTRRAPTFADGWARLAALHKDLGENEAMARTIVSGLEHCPESPSLHLMWGSALRQAGHLSEAIPALRRSIELRPNEAAAYVELGHVLAAQGQVEAGVDQLRRSLEVEPGNPAAITFLAFHAISSRDRVEADRWMAQVARQPRVSADAAGVLRQNYRRSFGHDWKLE